MNKALLTVLCVAVLATVPACKRDQNAETPKKEKMEKKTYRKKQDGEVIEEKTTTKSTVEMPAKNM